MLALFLKCSNAKATRGSVDKGSRVRPARCLRTNPFCSVLDPANVLSGSFGVTQGTVCKCAAERPGAPRTLHGALQAQKRSPIADYHHVGQDSIRYNAFRSKTVKRYGEGGTCSVCPSLSIREGLCHEGRSILSPGIRSIVGDSSGLSIPG